jgi:preprotein translocase subunit SecA
VYVTNAELGFDYLRDHLSYTTSGCVMPSGWRNRFCLVDEADSIFIDEARTPLIISKSVETDGQKFNTATTLANALKPGIHYDVDLKKKNVILTEAGYEDCQRALKVDSLFEVKEGGSWAGYVVSAVKAKEVRACECEDVANTVLTPF